MLSTRAAFLHGMEVVEVEFDPAVIGYDALLERGRQKQCATKVFTRTDAQQRLAAAKLGANAVRTDEAVRVASDVKYYTSRTPWRFLPMTSLQAARVNARVADAKRHLSPRQLALAEVIEKHPDAEWPAAIDVPLERAWAAADAVRRKLAGSR